MNIRDIPVAPLVLLIVTGLNGCASAETLAKFDTNSARIVYGVQSDVPAMKFGWLSGPMPSITMQLVNPATSEPQCANGRTFVTSGGPTKVGSMAYFLFDVPSGAYRATQPEIEPAPSHPFIASSGSMVYIGDYMIRGTNADIASGTPSNLHIRFSRDLDAARRALGQTGASMTVAEASTSQVSDLSGPCPKSYGVEVITPILPPVSQHP